MIIPLLMNIATICFLLASFPQMLKSFKRRKTSLKDFSLLSWMIGMVGITLMGTIGFLVGAWITVIIEVWHVFYHSATIYWMIKYRRTKRKKKKKKSKKKKQSDRVVAFFPFFPFRPQYY